MPKVLSTPFKAQVITLYAFRPETPTGAEPLNTLMCPVRAVHTYIEHSRQFRLSEQLFVCFGGRTKGLPVSKQRLSHWIVDAIALAYSSKGAKCPIGVRAHSTRQHLDSHHPGPVQMPCLFRTFVRRQAGRHPALLQGFITEMCHRLPRMSCQCEQRTRLLSLSYDLRCVSVVSTRLYTPCIDHQFNAVPNSLSQCSYGSEWET